MKYNKVEAIDFLNSNIPFMCGHCEENNNGFMKIIEFNSTEDIRVKCTSCGYEKDSDLDTYRESEYWTEGLESYFADYQYLSKLDYFTGEIKIYVGIGTYAKDKYAARCMLESYDTDTLVELIKSNNVEWDRDVSYEPNDPTEDTNKCLVKNGIHYLGEESHGDGSLEYSKFDDLKDYLQYFITVNNIEDISLEDVDDDNGCETILVDLDGCPFTFSIDKKINDIRAVVQFICLDSDTCEPLYIDALTLYKIASSQKMSVTEYILEHVDVERANNMYGHISNGDDYKALMKRYHD